MVPRAVHEVPEEIRLILASGGAAGELMAGVDWPATAVGPPALWPQSLRTAVSVCLSSRFPMLIWWGRDLVNIYNDALVPLIGGKHPAAMGQRGQECWAEIWDTVGPMLHGVLDGHGATYAEDQLLLLHRFGFLEEAYFTFSYSPISDETGKVGGVFTAAMETTGRVLGERRLRALRAVAAATSGQETPGGVLRAAADVLAQDAADVPFCLLLTGARRPAGGPDGADPQVVATCGPPDAAETVLADSRVAAALRGWSAEDGDRVVTGLAVPAGDVVVGDVVVLPVDATGAEATLVAGLSPLRPYDEDYRAFFSLLAGQLATGLGEAAAYEAARARAEALAELDAAKTAFFSNVSHEFRTPLTLLLGPLEDALEDPGEPLAGGQRERVELAHRNALRLLRLVNTLLDFSRLEAGRVTARFEPVDLAALTTDLAGMFRSATERAGLDLRVRCEPLPGPVHVDREMWEKVVGNLLSNAVKHTFAGGIDVVLGPVEQGVRLQVADTGTGIDPEEQGRLFERFHRVVGARSRSHEGSGIGLALVAELVRLHGGTVAVDSTPGVGSTFSVVLPLGSAHLPPDQVVAPGEGAAGQPTGYAGYAEEAARWVQDPAAAPAPAREPAGRPRASVLVVDDNADMRDYLEALLRPHHRVVLARDGRQALEALRTDPPDLVLADVMMPGLDGRDLVRTIRGDPALAHLPVILLSARAGEEAAVEGLDVGADDYLVKPFSTRELLARIRSNLELDRSRRSRAELERQQVLLDEAQRLSQVGSWEVDLRTGRLAGSAEYLRQMQMTAEDLASTDLEEIITSRVPPEDAERVRGAVARAAAEGGVETDVPLVTPDGVERTYHVRGVVEYDVDGTPTVLRGSSQDVTDSRRAEQAVAAAVAAREAAAREHRIASELQASLLPSLGFAPENLQVAVCYRAGAAETEIGGDWYDVIELGAGRTALVIGDVMGRGVRAAAVMGQVRAALRAYSRLDLRPADVVELLDGAVQDLGSEHIVTCIYAVYDPADGTLVVANAGHPPPVLVQDGVARRLTGPVSPPLGTGIATVAEARAVIGDGDLLALYTDGLVERRGEDIDLGIDALTGLLVDPGSPLEDLPGALVERLRPSGSDDDDIALLLVRVRHRDPATRAPSVVTTPVDSRSDAVSGARAFAVEALTRWDLPEVTARDVNLVVSELVTNAVLHGRPPVTLRLRHTGTHVVVEVEDAATVLPKRMRPRPEDEHGRGIELTSILSDRWGARPTRGGKAVWCSFALSAAGRRARRESTTFR